MHVYFRPSLVAREELFAIANILSNFRRDFPTPASFQMLLRKAPAALRSGLINPISNKVTTDILTRPRALKAQDLVDYGLTMTLMSDPEMLLMYE